MNFLFSFHILYTILFLYLCIFLYVDMHTKTQASKDKRSSYASQRGYRYDGIYRIEKCWQVAGQQVNRYDKYFDDLV